MNKYVVLLRGINVGGKNSLPMKTLTQVLEANKFVDVRTYIQSGNVVLHYKNRPDKLIATLIEDTFAFKPEVLALDAAEFNAAIDKNPFQSTQGKAIHFYFCKDKPKANFEKLDQLKSETEAYKIIDKVLYLHAPDGIGRSKLAAAVEACLGVAVTARNLNTVNKLASMLNDE